MLYKMTISDDGIIWALNKRKLTNISINDLDLIIIKKYILLSKHIIATISIFLFYH